MEVKYTMENIGKVASDLLSLIASPRVIALNGSMGAGKTTLVREVCTLLGVENNISSPTFSIIHQYKARASQFIYHIDLYRIRDEQEAIQAGVEECIYSGDTCFIEWPDSILHLLPHGFLNVNIVIIDEFTRRLTSKVEV